MMLPPGSDIVSGREAIEKEWEGTIKSGMKFVGLKTLAVEEYCHDAAREIGHFTVEVPNPQKEMTKVEGKYVVVWKHVDGKWMLDSDIWNMNSQEMEFALGLWPHASQGPVKIADPGRTQEGCRAMARRFRADSSSPRPEETASHRHRK